MKASLSKQNHMEIPASKAKAILKKIKTVYDRADPALGAANTGLETYSAATFITGMSYFAYAMCQLDLSKNPDEDPIKQQLVWAAGVAPGAVGGILMLADIYNQYRKGSANDNAESLTRFKAALLGMYAGGVFSDQALVGIFNITNCSAILGSNIAAMTLLGAARFASYTHTNVPVRYVQNLRQTRRLNELLVVAPPSKNVKILKAIAGILVAGATGLAVYHSGYALAVGDFPPKYGRNIGKTMTGLLFGAGGLAATLLDKKHPEAAYRWKQFVTVLSEATLIERGLNSLYDLDNSPYDSVFPIMTVFSLLISLTKANREIPFHRIQAELLAADAGLPTGDNARVCVVVDDPAPAAISLSPPFPVRGHQTGTNGSPTLSASSSDSPPRTTSGSSSGSDSPGNGSASGHSSDDDKHEPLPPPANGATKLFHAKGLTLAFGNPLTASGLDHTPLLAADGQPTFDSVQEAESTALALA